MLSPAIFRCQELEENARRNAVLLIAAGSCYVTAKDCICHLFGDAPEIDSGRYTLVHSVEFDGWMHFVKLCDVGIRFKSHLMSSLY